MKFCQEDFERLVAHHAFTHRFLQSRKGTRRTADGIHVLERLRDPFPGINPGNLGRGQPNAGLSGARDTRIARSVDKDKP